MPHPNTYFPAARPQYWADPQGTTVGECLAAVADCYAEIAAIYRRAAIYADIKRQATFQRRSELADQLSRDIRPDLSFLDDCF